MQTYDEMSTTKGHPCVPQESQDYVMRSPKVERNKSSRPSDTVPCPCALKELHYLKGRLNNWYPNTHLGLYFPWQNGVERFHGTWRFCVILRRRERLRGELTSLADSLIPLPFDDDYIIYKLFSCVCVLKTSWDRNFVTNYLNETF